MVNIIALTFPIWEGFFSYPIFRYNRFSLSQEGNLKICHYEI